MQTWDELPGFRTYRDFFAELETTFEPVMVDAATKRRLIDAIPQIEFIGERTSGMPGLHDRRLSGILDDWRYSAIIREVRRYGRTHYVRYEVASLYPTGEWASPICLMAVFDEDFNVLRYTFIHETGKLRHGVIANDCLYKRYYNLDYIKKRFLLLDFGEWLMVYNADKFSENIAIKHINQDEYCIDWSSHDYPWFFAPLEFVNFKTAQRFFNAFCKNGLLGVQDMMRWVVESREDIITHPAYYDERHDIIAQAVRAKRRLLK